MPISNADLRSNNEQSSTKLLLLPKKKKLSPVELGKKYYDRLMKKETVAMNNLPTHQRMTARNLLAALASPNKKVTKKQEALAYGQAWYLDQFSNRTSIEDISDDELEEPYDDDDDDAVALNEVVVSSRSFYQPKADEQSSIVTYHQSALPGNTTADQKPAVINVPGVGLSSADETSIQTYNNEDACGVVSETTSILPYNNNFDKDVVAMEEEEVSTVASTATSQTVTRQKRFTTKVTIEFTTTFEEEKEEASGDDDEEMLTNHQKEIKTTSSVTCTRELNLKEKIMRSD